MNIELIRNDFPMSKILSAIGFILLYLFLPFLCMIILSDGFHFDGLPLLLVLFISVWANDTFAYLWGISIGKRRLLEHISPKKSWEGFFGGLIITVAAAWLLSGWFGLVSSSGWIIIALIIAVAGTYGDLTESMLKRSIGVKDSGSLLPGHGGLLDRFDSTLFAFPLVYLFVTLFG